MSELQTTKELKGLSGWLVLFQIQVWSILAGTVQMLVLFPIMGIVMKNLFSFGNVHMYTYGTFDTFNVYYSPYTYVFAAAIFVFTLLCIIFFYKKRLVFRVFFIIESVINIIGIVLLSIFVTRSMANMYSARMFSEWVLIVTFTAFYIIPIVGIAVAFIIALYKSKRVKNTFS